MIEGSATQAASFDFAAGTNALQSASAALSDLAPNGTTTLQWGGVYLDGSNSTLNVFTVPAWAVASAWGFEVSVPSSSTVLVNVTGDGAKFWYMGFDLPGLSPSQVIWNLPDTTWLRIEGVGVIGSILAPSAWVTFNNGVVEGQIFGAGFDGWGQTNLHPFARCIPPATGGQPALSITLAAPATALPGGSITYSLTATNIGNADALNTTASVHLPDGALVALSFGPIAPGQSNTLPVAWTVPLPALRLATESSVEYVARLAELNGRALGASASAAWSDAASASFGPATAAASTIEQIPVLEMTLSAASTAQSGDSLQYSVVLHNAGQAASPSVVASVLLPDGSTATPAVPAIAAGATTTVVVPGELHRPRGQRHSLYL